MGWRSDVIPNRSREESIAPLQESLYEASCKYSRHPVGKDPWQSLKSTFSFARISVRTAIRAAAAIFQVKLNSIPCSRPNCESVGFQASESARTNRDALNSARSVQQ